MNNNKQNKSLSNNAKKIANKTLNTTKDLAAKAQTTLGNAATKIKNTANQISENVKQKVSNAGNKSNLKEPLTKLTSTTDEFFNSNTAISKFVVFFLSLVLFVIIFQIGMSLIHRFISPNENPYLIQGMVKSDRQKMININPSQQNSIPIYRSVDKGQGIEYSWNVWFAADNEVSIQTNSRIFSKSPPTTDNYNNSYMTGGIAKKFVNSSPGLFLTKGYDSYTAEEVREQTDIYNVLNSTTTDSIRDKLNTLHTNLGTMHDGSIKMISPAASYSIDTFNTYKITYTNYKNNITDIEKLITDLYDKIYSSKLYKEVNKIYLELQPIKTIVNETLNKLNEVKFTTITTNTNLSGNELSLSKVPFTYINANIPANISNKSPLLTNTINALDYAKNVAYQNKEDVTTSSANLSKPKEYNLTLVMNTFDNKDDPNRILYEKVIHFLNFML